MAAQPPPFVLAPALIGQNQPINYSTRAGQHLYAISTATLPYIFEGKDSSLPAFLQAIKDRSAQTGWEDIYEITLGINVARNIETHDMLTK